MCLLKALNGLMNLVCDEGLTLMMIAEKKVGEGHDKTFLGKNSMSCISLIGY